MPIPALQQIAEPSTSVPSGRVTSLTKLTTNNLRKCFEGKGCGQCGACCEFPFGFNVPTVRAISMLRKVGTEKDGAKENIVFTQHGPKILVEGVATIVETQLKTILGCPHHKRNSEGKSICGVMDIRMRHPDLFINCNGFDGGAGLGVTKNGRGKQRETTNKHELCTFIVDVLFSPGQYSSLLFETAHENYLLTGELDEIVPELREAMVARAKYNGGGFFDAICDGYISAMKSTDNVPAFIKFVKDFGDFLHRNNLHEVLQQHYKDNIIRSYSTLKYANFRLLLWGNARDVFLQSFFPFFFKKSQEYVTDPHKGMVC